MWRATRLIVVGVVVAAGCARDTSEHASPSTASSPRAASGGAVIATYNSKRFTSEDFAREIERLPPRSRTQLTTPERKRQFVDNYILNDLLADEGTRRGYDKDPDITRQVDELRRRLVVQHVMKDLQEPPEVTDPEVQAYYDQNRRLFSGGQIRASHILVKDEDLAKRLREELRADPSKFEELAKANSVDTATAARGGDLGFFGQGRMVAPFEQAAFSLDKSGDISEVVKTAFGYHIIKLTDRKEGADRPFDEVKERIRVNLLNQRRQELTQQRLDELRAKANAKIDDAALAAAEVPGGAPETGAGAPGTASHPGGTAPMPARPGAAPASPGAEPPAPPIATP